MTTDPAPVLVPTHSFSRSATIWRISRGVGTVVCLGLMLVAVLLVLTSCTIERVILYNTEIPSPRPTGER